eukprot:s1312_g12.t1
MPPCSEHCHLAKLFTLARKGFLRIFTNDQTVELLTRHADVICIHLPRKRLHQELSPSGVTSESAHGTTWSQGERTGRHSLDGQPLC